MQLQYLIEMLNKMKSTNFREQSNPNLILIIYLSTAVITLIAVPFLASRWNQQPFIGGFLSPSMQFTKFSNLLSNEIWPVQELGFGDGETLTALDGQPVDSSLDIQIILSEYQPGDSISMTIMSAMDESRQVEVELVTFSNFAKFIYIYLPLFIALLCFLCGLWAYSDQRKLTINMAFTAFATSLAIMISTYYDYFTTHQLVPLFFASLGLAAGSLLQIVCLFPWQRKSKKQSPWLSAIGYPHNILLIGIAIYQFQNPSENLSLSTCTWMLFLSFGVSMIVFIIASVMVVTRLSSPKIKRQFKKLIGAALISFIPIALHFIISLVSGSESPINPLYFILFCILPITYTIQIRRYLLPQTKKVFNHSLVYILFSLIFGVLCLIIVSVLNHIIINPIFPNNPLIIGMMVFLVVFTIEPIQKMVERNLFMPTSSSEWVKNLAMNFSSSLTATNNLDLAVDLLKDIIDKTMNPEHIHVYLYDPQIPGFAAKLDMVEEGKNLLVVPHDSVIATTIDKLRDILYFKEEYNRNKNTKNQIQLWDEAGSCIFAPIPGSFGLHGWVAIGPKQNGILYSVDDIDLLDTLIHQFSMVYERADAMTSIRDRLHEIEILTRIATTININNDFDNMLISILKEIQSIIPIDCFSLVLDSERKGFYDRLFLFENGKRVISTDQPQPLREDFREMTGIEEGKPKILQDDGTWLIVPLTADEQIIGALSLGHSSETTIFDRIDFHLVNSIASLINGAIIKADLLRLSKQQADQLSIINKVSEQLTSTLILETLLRNILNGAMEILSSSSGTLLIVSKTGEDLEFRVTAGPIGAQVTGKHLPINEGIAGESYRTRKPIIQNVIERNKQLPNANPTAKVWIDNILAVPLIARGAVIGVLEIINKKNKVPFNEKDVSILEGFANQAAIAIHNATIYTNTDRALENRIEELYIMQKIDRDLNLTRDVNQAIQVMLKAAISHTHAVAGSIGLVENQSGRFESVIQILPDSSDPIEKKSVELRDFPWFLQDEEKGYQLKKSAKLSEQLGINNDYGVHYLKHSELEDNKSVLLILHLESSKALVHEDLEFLIRLNDHAVIALKNAYLDQELHEAIQIKNEFISYISHELKNPLTVIKGYADILRKGMAGEINEEQTDFLSTITHNVRQMNTFITDLSDQSRLESRSLRLIFDSTSITEVINEVLHTYENQINEKSLEVQVQVNKDVPDVWCDRLRLIQILSNLVSNAIKYTPEEGRITVGAQHAINEWDDKGSAEVAHIWAEDNGYGISIQDQEHLFEKFFRGTGTHIGRIPGSGLGLRISKTLTEMMGGKMWFESTEGKGSTFHFTMPI